MSQWPQRSRSSFEFPYICCISVLLALLALTQSYCFTGTGHIMKAVCSSAQDKVRMYILTENVSFKQFYDSFNGVAFLRSVAINVSSESCPNMQASVLELSENWF